MKSLLSAAFVLFALTITSFTNNPEIANFEKFGTYIGGGSIETSHIQLKLNEDKTYSYKDISNSDNPVQITGTWEQDGSRIYLKGNEEIKFHSNWKIDNECACLKSKKGMTFYRLCQ